MPWLSMVASWPSSKFGGAVHTIGDVRGRPSKIIPANGIWRKSSPVQTRMAGGYKSDTGIPASINPLILFGDANYCFGNIVLICRIMGGRDATCPSKFRWTSRCEVPRTCQAQHVLHPVRCGIVRTCPTWDTWSGGRYQTPAYLRALPWVQLTSRCQLTCEPGAPPPATAPVGEAHSNAMPTYFVWRVSCLILGQSWGKPRPAPC